MSMELEAVIESCVKILQRPPQRSREEIALLLNQWEDMGIINRQMRALIVQQLRQGQIDFPRGESGNATPTAQNG